jgi:crotonobetainyl-CoA:carnitine CoA-transferase CaiB-like acyl-CoA transferase
LEQINSRIISCSISGYGPNGPLGGSPGFDPLLQAQSGMQRAQGGDAEPVFLQIGINDTGTGAVAAFGVIGALYAREKSGRGQQLYTYLANQSVMGQSGEICRYRGAPEPERGGLDHIGRSPVYRFYECTGGRWIAVACRHEGEVQGLYQMLGRQEWVKSYPAEVILTARADEACAGQIASILLEMDAEEAIVKLRSAGVPAAIALRLEAELFEDKHLSANGFWHLFELPGGERFNMMAHWALWTRTQADPQPPADAIGAQTVTILRQFGLNEETISRLLNHRVVRQAAGE